MANFLMGLELEFGVGTGKDPTKIMNEANGLVQSGFRRVSLEPQAEGEYPIFEISSHPHDNPKDIIEDMWFCYKSLKTVTEQARFYFNPWLFRLSPNEDLHPWAYASQRQLLMHQAFKREVGESWVKILKMAMLCSTQVTIGVDPMSNRGILVMNVLNNLGPSIAEYWANVAKVDNSGRMISWTEFSDPRRCPWNYRFKSPADLVKTFESIPATLVGNDKKDDTWRLADLGTFQSVKRPSDEGVTFWLARPRFQWKAIEFRPVGSMDPPYVADFISFMFQIVQIILDSQNEDEAILRINREYPRLPSMWVPDAEWKKLLSK